MAAAGATSTARSGCELGEASTQTEPPRVDAAIQADPSAEEELSGGCGGGESAPQPPPPGSARPASNRRQLAAGSRPASRPATQSRGQPATAAGATAASFSGRRQSAQQPQQQQQQWPIQQPATPASSTGGGGQPGVLFVDNNKSWLQFQESSRQQRRLQGGGGGGAECTPMVYSYNPDPRLRAWQSLEHARLHQLGLSSKLSRRYNVQRSAQFIPVGLHMRALQQPPVRAAFLPPLAEEYSAEGARRKNDVAPFLTFQKPTCGYFFSRETDNRKAKHGLAPADLPSWGADLLLNRQ